MAEALKDMFFQEKFFRVLCEEIKTLHPIFDREQFWAEIFSDGWEDRALKDRMRHTTLTLHNQMPEDFRQSLDILYQLLPRLEGFGFEKMIFPDYVELYGLADWEASLPAFETFTQSMSAEFAVRPFIVQDQERMMAQMRRWADHEHTGVRRLASEGCRPRLPWAIALPGLQKDPSSIFPILEKLIQDPEETVRRSVANNLNDISKDHPDQVVAFLTPYQNNPTPELVWIINHAMRSLFKAGHAGAMTLMGYGGIDEISFTDFVLTTPQVQWNGEIGFSFSVTSHSEKPLDLMIDYAMGFLRQNGKHGRKVFKLNKCTLKPGENLSFSRKFSFAPITTRVYYPGLQEIEIQINGQVVGKLNFDLLPAV